MMCALCNQIDNDNPHTVHNAKLIFRMKLFIKMWLYRNEKCRQISVCFFANKTKMFQFRYLDFDSWEDIKSKHNYKDPYGSKLFKKMLKFYRLAKDE